MRDFMRQFEMIGRERLATFMAGQPVFPIQMEIFPTEICNHHCQWCVSEDYRAPSNTLDWLHLQTFLLAARQHGLQEVHICGGGEPLVYPYIAELLAHCRQLGLGVLVYTNGSLNKPQALDELVQTAFEVRISVDAGDAQTYSRVRRVPTSAFDQTLAVIRALLQRRGNAATPRIVLSFVGAPETLDSVPGFLRLVQELGVDGSILKTNIHQADSERAVSLQRMITLAQATLGDWPVADVRAYDAPQDVFGYVAEGIWATVPLKAVLHSNWDVYPCCHAGGQARYRLGNLLQETLETVLLSERTYRLQRELVFGDHEQCLKCVQSDLNKRSTALMRALSLSSQ